IAAEQVVEHDVAVRNRLVQHHGIDVGPHADRDLVDAAAISPAPVMCRDRASIGVAQIGGVAANRGEFASLGSQGLGKIYWMIVALRMYDCRLCQHHHVSHEYHGDVVLDDLSHIAPSPARSKY